MGSGLSPKPHLSPLRRLASSEADFIGPVRSAHRLAASERMRHPSAIDLLAGPIGHDVATPGEDKRLEGVVSALSQLEHAVHNLKDYGIGRRQVPFRFVQRARRLYAMRRDRDQLMGDLFGEPAWDMLLELFVAGAEDRKTPVKNLCLSACTSLSTAMRRLDCLITAGLVVKADDEGDARRSLVDLSDRGWQIMQTLLQHQI